jgi:multidrug efflux system membrane fusion protein
MPPVIARLLFVAATISMGAACRSEPVANAAAAPAPPPPAVHVQTVELRSVSPTEELTGRIAAVHDVEVRARVSGYVTAVRYREGADVAKGATLFTIDPRPYQAVLDRATADLARAQARAELGRTEAARADKLLASNVIPQAERDVAAATAAQANAEVAAARATVTAARLDVEFTQVRAPMAGRTSRASVSVGDFVTAGGAPTALTTIATTGPVHVYFTRNEPSFLRLGQHALGAPISVGLGDEPGFPHTGTIDFVDNHFDASTGTIRMRALLPDPDHRLTPGLHARVRVAETTEIPALLVDDKAIMTDQDRKYVYVLGAGDTVERRDLTLGRMFDGMRIVSAGLTAGDRVITNGTQKVYPGSKASIAPAAAAPVKAATSGGARP